MKKISVLGSTGSIGTQTLQVVRDHEDLSVTALAAGSNVEKIKEQIEEFRPKLACLYDEEKAKELKEACRHLPVRIVSGMEGLIECATQPEAEIVFGAIVGMIGIVPTIEAIKAGKDIALANGGFGAFGHLPGASRRGEEGDPQDSADRVRRAVPGKDSGRAAGCARGGCAAPPELGDGTEDYHRFVYNGE